MLLNRKKLFFITLLSVGLIGCKNPISKHVSCDDEDATTLVHTVLINDLDKQLDKELKDLIKQGGIKDLDPAKLKVSAKSVQYNIVDSRTDFIDPNSTKTKCSVDLTVIITDELVKKSNEAREKLNADSVESQASKLNVDYSNNKVNLVLEYILQPTDKGDKVLATVENKTEIQKLISDTLIYAFLKPQIEKNIIKNIEAAKLAQRQEQVETSEAYDEAQNAAADAVAAAEVTTAYEDY